MKKLDKKNMGKNSKKVLIVDYGMGNVGSVKNALDYLKIESIISNKESQIERSTHIILPGVGAFGEGMKNLNSRDLVGILKKAVFENKKPFLGICLGMQLFSKIGEEDGLCTGLGWIDGKTRRFKVNKKKFRLPHVGWNNLEVVENNPLFEGTEPNIFYFVHSFHLDPDDKSLIAAKCEYGEVFCASIRSHNIFGVQFHPERSQKCGLKLLENFLNFES